MESRLKKRIESLETKASQTTPVAAWWEDPEKMAESVKELRRQFAAHLAEGERRKALPLAEQLAIAREELEDALSSQAKLSAQTVPHEVGMDENRLKLMEAFKRRRVEHLEAEIARNS